MKSRASLAGHPLHPMLILIPAGGFLLTFILDLVHFFTGVDAWWTATRPVLLVSVIGAVVAAIPGLIDLVLVVPKGRAKDIGLAHMALNLFLVCLFVANTWVRWTWPMDMPLEGTPGMPLTVLGVAVLAVSGWFGWTMVQTWHVGVLEEGERGNMEREQGLADPHTSPG